MIVRWDDPRAEVREPNGSARSSGVTLLDDWIASHYPRAQRFGNYVLLTGTPWGCGEFMDPPRSLAPGDVVETEVERIGRLRNPVVAAATGESSRKGESASTNSSMRSRGSSFPRWWCRATYFSPPPARARPMSASSAAMRSSMAVRLVA